MKHFVGNWTQKLELSRSFKRIEKSFKTSIKSDKFVKIVQLRQTISLRKSFHNETSKSQNKIPEAIVIARIGNEYCSIVCRLFTSCLFVVFSLFQAVQKLPNWTCATRDRESKLLNCQPSTCSTFFSRKSSLSLEWVRKKLGSDKKLIKPQKKENIFLNEIFLSSDKMSWVLIVLIFTVFLACSVEWFKFSPDLFVTREKRWRRRKPNSDFPSARSKAKNIAQEIDFFLVDSSLPSRRRPRRENQNKKKFETVLKIKKERNKIFNFNFSGQTSGEKKSVNFHQSHCWCLFVLLSLSRI